MSKNLQAKHNRGRSAAISGLLLRKPKEFWDDVKRALRSQLKLSHVSIVCRPQGARALYYFSNDNLAVAGAEETNSLPCLKLYEGVSKSAWIVVELETDAVESAPRQGTALQHISLKLFIGPTPNTAALFFRGEWDLRDNKHAQPHWNIHDAAWQYPGTEPPRFDASEKRERFVPDEVDDISGSTQSPRFEQFLEDGAAAFLERLTPNRAATVPVETQADRMSTGAPVNNPFRFHFAMAAAWCDEKGGPGRKLEETESATRWVQGCLGYIHYQLVEMEL